MASGMPCGRHVSVGAHAEIACAIVVRRFRPRQEWRSVRQVRRDVVDVLRPDAAVGRHDEIADHLPDSGEIRFSI
jgi:hypothetical protein